MSLPQIKDLCEILDDIVQKYNISYMDAAIHFCDETGVEIESVANVIRANQKLKAKLQVEAEDLHYMAHTNRL